MSAVLDAHDELIVVNTKPELTAIKQKYGEDVTKEAWQMLSDDIKIKIKAICAADDPGIAPISAPDPEPTPKPKPRPTPVAKAPIKKLPRLWELSAELVQITDKICDVSEDETLGELEKDKLRESLFNDWLATGEDFDSKATQVASYIKQQEALEETYRQQYRSFRALAEQTEKEKERYKKYLSDNLLKTGKIKIQNEHGSISLRKKPAKVILDREPEQLPQEFQKVTVEPRLSLIKDHLKSNPNCDFAHISTIEEYGLIIK